MESTLRSQSIPINPSKFKKHYESFQKCPLCHERIQIGVEWGFLENVKQYPYPHVILHGTPLHGLVVYFDADFSIRAVETIESIEIQRNSETFGEILKKWSNPF